MTWFRRWRDGTVWHHVLVANGRLWWTCRDCRALHRLDGQRSEGPGLVNRRDRAVIRACDLMLKLATPRTRARVGVALRRAAGQLVPTGMLSLADFDQMQDRVP